MRSDELSCPRCQSNLYDLQDGCLNPNCTEDELAYVNRCSTLQTSGRDNARRGSYRPKRKIGGKSQVKSTLVITRVPLPLGPCILSKTAAS